MSELAGTLIAVSLTIALGMAVASRRWPRSLKRLIYAALMLRVVGATLRYVVLFEVYNGAGDAVEYFRRGRIYADRFTRFDFSPLYDSTLWLRDQWWGTSFISFPSGFVLSVIGPSLLGEFIVFSLFAFLGLVGFAAAFRHAYPHIPVKNYARWIFLFPSLWFWPSSVGKDALVLMGIGLAIWGFVGDGNEKKWPLLVAGNALVFAIRPQVCAVLLLCFVLSQWLSFGGRWTSKKAFQGGLILALGMGGIVLGMRFVGVESVDVEGIQEYMVTESARSTSGSTVGTVEVGIKGVPIAIVNILFRPFIWEAGNVMAMASALEILGLWAIVWYRRRNLGLALKTWRSHPMLRVAVPFIIVYSATLGIMIVNLGIIARQRIFLFPFLFLLLEVVPGPEKRRSSKRRRRPPPAGPHRRPRLRGYPVQ